MREARNGVSHSFTSRALQLGYPCGFITFKTEDSFAFGVFGLEICALQLGYRWGRNCVSPGLATGQKAAGEGGGVGEMVGALDVDSWLKGELAAFAATDDQGGADIGHFIGETHEWLMERS